MSKQSNILSLADQYDLKDLEPDADRERAAAYLAAESQPPSTSPSRKRRATTPIEPAAPRPAKEVVAPPEPWTSRTIRIRKSTATALTKAVCSQKSKQAEGTLTLGEPVTVQEIADRGIRLALAELGLLN